MSLEPQKFFIGLMDFFSIILPGALLTYLFSDAAGSAIFKTDPIPGGTEGWIVFLFSSYLLGHFIFLVGSWLLDDHVYDRLRNGTYEGQIRTLAAGNERPGKFVRRAARYFFKGAADRTLRQVLTIRDRYVETMEGEHTVNAFQWSKARLAIKQPATMLTVERFEADSKFFRSLIVVLLITLPWMLATASWVNALGMALLLPLAFWRYVDQRMKAINQAYYYVITMESENAVTAGPVARMTPRTTTHGGGVVYRSSGRELEYLFVESSRERDRWVLPKGHIRRGERTEEAAVREVLEESGVWGKVEAMLDEIAFEAAGESVRAQFYLMSALEQEASPEQRRCKWLKIEDALGVVHEDMRDLLQQADQRARESKRAATDAEPVDALERAVGM